MLKQLAEAAMVSLLSVAAFYEAQLSRETAALLPQLPRFPEFARFLSWSVPGVL
jgi:hypothetical protein